jgi:hypothetical protein
MNPDLFQISPFTWWFGAVPTLMQFISMVTYSFWWLMAILIALVLLAIVVGAGWYFLNLGSKK